MPIKWPADVLVALGNSRGVKGYNTSKLIAIFWKTNVSTTGSVNMALINIFTNDSVLMLE